MNVEYIVIIPLKYRSQTDICYHILDAANGGATKTKIMYKAFLSSIQLKDYLPMLIEGGLLEFYAKIQTFKTTEKGIRFLKAYDQISELVSV
jgi:predicted transcriptional regulator